MKTDQISSAVTENHSLSQPKSGCDPKKQSMLHGGGGAMDEAEVVFRKFDKNGDGKISPSELAAILNALGTMTVSEEEVDRIMKEVDLDGDGFIDIKEFAAVYFPSDGGGSNSHEKDLREAFDLYDIDKNGKITASELHKTLKRLGEKCSIKECRRMISQVDVDGDGCVNFEEFKNMMREKI
ncbi:unnamed protein product [Cuscuta campestris]|uniref:EF-hand domain-containing protein n=2 Tax=Cuscuta sect. Cleistogrammica TaxID=1824901 RepID=A0A484NFW4_9ASTE|nr:hypothetical protein DM860_004908 [Cuscuta australis]VFQ99970.1 unnamed protein product [Cuscuta campestris]